MSDLVAQALCAVCFIVAALLAWNAHQAGIIDNLNKRVVGLETLLKNRRSTDKE